MGFLKKIFKPVSKVLDKVIPNEIKPFLPYAAAFAPMFAPGIMGAFGGSALSRAAIGGGLNIFGQLAQEGNEGDINLLSAGLGALTGAMTGPGAADKFSSMTTKGAMDPALGSSVQGDILANRSFLTKATDAGLEGLAKGSKMFAAGMDKPFSMAGLKAATLPAATATGDVMEASARQLEKQQAIDDALAQAELIEDSGARAAAIRNAMNAYGFFTDEEIDDTIFSAGYADGGRVGFKNAGLAGLPGLPGLAPKEESKYITKKSDTSETDTINRIYEEQGSDGLSSFLERNPDLKDKYVIVADGMSGELTIMPNKLHPDFMDKESIIMLGDGDGGIIDMSNMFKEEKAKGGRVGFDNGGGVDFGGIPAAIKNVETAKIEDVSEIVELDDLSKLDGFAEMLSNMDESDPKYNEIRKMGIQEAEMVGEKYKISPVDLVGYLDKKTNMFNERTKEIKLKEIDDGKKEELMEKVKNTSFAFADGGLMNLGGKEMDMRGGGFIPIGKKERADDVPARLSKNEFVMTADAVRAAGGGSVNKGAKRMYDLMNNLEARG